MTTFNSNRKFGVEVEFTYHSLEYGDSHMVALAETVTRVSGEEVRYLGYTHATHSYWKLVRDGSCGWELVSPPLSGQDGLAKVKKVLQALSAQQGVSVNRACGLHVHVDTTGLRVDDIKNCYKRYHDFESKIDSFMPGSRRANNNQYCQSLPWDTGMNTQVFNNLSSINALGNFFHSRYYKINLQSLLRHGTIEFRQHSGTTNGSKVTNWIKFCVGFVEASRVSSANSNAAPVRIHRRMQAGNKLRRMAHILAGYAGQTIEVETINLNVGVARSTVVAYCSRLRTEFGWSIRNHGRSYITVSAVGRIPGSLEQREFEQQRDAAYAATVREQAAHVVSSEDMWNRGIDEQVVSFLEARASSLQGAGAR